MIRVLLLASLVFAIVSCGGEKKAEKKKVDKKVLFGEYKNDIYENTFFNLKIDFEDRWKVNTTSFRTTFGGELFEAKYLGSTSRDYALNVTIEAEKANPFEKPSPVREAEESIEGYEMLFDYPYLTKKPLSKTTIAGEEYVVNQIQIRDEIDTSFINEYYRYKDGYYLSIVCIYNTQVDELPANNFISSITKR